MTRGQKIANAIKSIIAAQEELDTLLREAAAADYDPNLKEEFSKNYHNQRFENIGAILERHDIQLDHTFNLVNSVLRVKELEKDERCEEWRLYIDSHNSEINENGLAEHCIKIYELVSFTYPQLSYEDKVNIITAYQSSMFD